MAWKIYSFKLIFQLGIKDIFYNFRAKNELFSLIKCVVKSGIFFLVCKSFDVYKRRNFFHDFPLLLDYDLLAAIDSFHGQ